MAPAGPDLLRSPVAVERLELLPDTGELLYHRKGTLADEPGGEMRILAFLLEPVAIRKILTHLVRQARLASRDPP